MRGTTLGVDIGFEPLESRRLLSADLLSDAAGLSAANSVTIGGESYFFADNGVAGRELWKSDGTGAGTVLVKDLTAGANSTNVFGMYNLHGRCVFITQVNNGVMNRRGNVDYTLWGTDGTADGTVKLAEFKGDVWLKVAQAGDRLAILHHASASFDPISTDAFLWFTDGTANGTKLVKSFIAVSPDADGNGGTNFQSFSFLAAGERVVFNFDQQLWGSDGTAAGTIDISSAVGGDLQTYKVDLTKMVAIEGRVLIPGQNHTALWITDGTLAGTEQRPFDIGGQIDNSAVAGNTYYFVEALSQQNGNVWKTLYALDLDTGTLTNVYRTPGDGSDNGINIVNAGPRLLFTDLDTDSLVTTLWTTKGTPETTVKLGEFDNFAGVYVPVHVGETNYFVVSTGPYVEDAQDTSGVIGWIGSGGSLHMVNMPGSSKIELWRTDGTPESTGMVKTLWQGDANGKKATATLSEASGKLVVATKVLSGFDPKFYPNDESKLTVELDDSTAYDPRELNFGRNGATARLVNGFLRIGGSLVDDNIQMWRSSRDPNKLVVAYNGNERGFAFNSVSKIVVDLQDGNDYFEILEAEGGPIRARTSIFGGDGTDTIITGAGRDTIFGGAGGDKIRARGNADVISGGSGKDRINAGAGDDEIAGGTGYDQVVAGEGVDVLFGQTAVEKAFGEDLEGQDLAGDVLLSA
jgi:ELWxxDGT repeat protein